MPKANFCAECGDRLSRKGWRAWSRARLCVLCAHRLGSFAAFRGLFVLVLTAAAAFGFGRYLRPSPPPLIIQRLANSPLPDGPIDTARAADQAIPNGDQKSESNQPITNDDVYICGARTQKGTPCRRRVHAAGERCFQHKGMPSLVPLSKLVLRR